VLGELCNWTAGEFRRLFIGLYVPPTHGNSNRTGTYKGRLDCAALVGTDVVSEDFLDIEVHLADVVGSPHNAIPVSSFGGYRVREGALIYWSSFESIGLAGSVNLYREDPYSGGYTRVNGAPLAQNSEHHDTEAEPGTAYNYMLGIGHQGSEILVGPLAIRGAPDFLHLSQNVPNPFREWTTVDYQLPANSHVSLKIYDVAGRHVRTLRDCEELAGFYSLTWDRTDGSGRNVANGVYFYRLETPLRTETKKMIVLR
jgi:hypothetical protein